MSLTNLQQAYNRLPRFECAKVMTAIAAECDRTKATIYQWLKKPENVPKLARPVFAKHLDVPVNELWPETAMPQ